MSVESHFKDRPKVLFPLYRRWLAFVRRHGGPIEVSTNRTRIAFMGEVRFASLTVLKDRLRCSIALARPVRDPRFVRIKEEVPGWWAHDFELRERGDLAMLDASLAKLVAESWREFGMRGRLGWARSPRPR